ncbi:hypothetical protein BDR26DRAFT_1008966 [Obelidium mucronatum]|nr:hypothetical protein BDR26DRAFT_1008966 [Obelidium mucronatum]
MNSRLKSLCYCRAVMQHGVELLVLCAGVSVSSVQWLEVETPNKAVTIACDGYVAGNASIVLDSADLNQQSRRECALLSLFRLTDALSRLQDVNNPNGPRTSQGSLEHLDGYVPAVAPAALDLAAIKDYSRTVACNDGYHTALLALEDSLIRIDRIVLAAFETVKLAKHFHVIDDQNPTFEANIKSLADLPELNEPVPNTPVVVTDAFSRNLRGFGFLVLFADAIAAGNPDPFLGYVDHFFHVWELFRSSGDSRPDFAVEICHHTTPAKKWMQHKIEMGAVFEYFDYNLNWNGKDPTSTVGANVVVRFADKTTLRGMVSMDLNDGSPFKLLFRFEIAECSPADFGWEHVYPAGFPGLKVDKK